MTIAPFDCNHKSRALVVGLPSKTLASCLPHLASRTREDVLDSNERFN